MVEWKKLSLALALALAAFVAPLAPAGASAGGIGDCTHKIKLPTRDVGENIRVAIFLKTPGEELTAYTGKKGENEAPVKVGNSFPTFKTTKNKTKEATAENIPDAYELRAARHSAVLSTERNTNGGFQLYIRLKHPDGPEAVCAIDADQDKDSVNGIIEAKLSRLKCLGIKSRYKISVNSCQARDFRQANGVRVGYWAEVEFVE